jgi:uncharacterized membrane protein
MQDFIIGRPPVSPIHMPWLFILSDLIIIAGALGIMTRRFGYQGSLICGIAIFLFSYLLKIFPEFTQNDFIKNINNGPAWKILTLSGGCLVVANTFRNKKTLFYTGLIAISCFFMWAGIAHFLYSSFVDTLIPDYIPFHRFWTLFCGTCLILASLGLWIPKLRKTVARLACIMIFGWFLMLHIPRSVKYSADKTELMAVFESLMIAALMLIVSNHFPAKDIADLNPDDAYKGSIMNGKQKLF